MNLQCAGFVSEKECGRRRWRVAESEVVADLGWNVFGGRPLWSAGSFWRSVGGVGGGRICEVSGSFWKRWRVTCRWMCDVGFVSERVGGGGGGEPRICEVVEIWIGTCFGDKYLRCAGSFRIWEHRQGVVGVACAGIGMKHCDDLSDRAWMRTGWYLISNGRRRGGASPVGWCDGPSDRIIRPGRRGYRKEW